MQSGNNERVVLWWLVEVKHKQLYVKQNEDAKLGMDMEVLMGLYTNH